MHHSSSSQGEVDPQRGVHRSLSSNWEEYNQSWNFGFDHGIKKKTSPPSG